MLERCRQVLPTSLLGQGRELPTTRVVKLLQGLYDQIEEEGKTEEDLYLDYLAKVGDKISGEIRKDLRPWPDGKGGLVNRRCATWEECHELCVVGR